MEGREGAKDGWEGGRRRMVLRENNGRESEEWKRGGGYPEGKKTLIRNREDNKIVCTRRR